MPIICNTSIYTKIKKNFTVNSKLNIEVPYNGLCNVACIFPLTQF